MSVRRGRPPVLAGGISGSSRAHWASVKLLGNPWPDCRCVSRCSLVHMPNHRLPIVVETVNHANLSDARNFWVRLSDLCRVRAHRGDLCASSVVGATDDCRGTVWILLLRAL